MSSPTALSRTSSTESASGVMFSATRDTNVTGGLFVHGRMTQNVYSTAEQGNGNVVGGFLVHGRMTQNVYNTGEGAWKELYTRAAANAMHDSDTLEKQGICLENTREIVLKLINDYLSSTVPDSRNILWLNGPAGSGKSAIARTIAKSTSKTQTLLGNFFFYHSDTTRNTITPFIPTLAVQICRRFRQARKLVEQAIEDNPLIFKKSTRAQATALIIDPLKQVLAELPASSSESPPLTILIDGLDECNDSDRQVEIINTLVELATALNTPSHSRIKVVIFSRPEACIRQHVAHHEKAGGVLLVALNGDLNPQSDIELYYNAQFEDIRRHHPMRRSLGPSWPSSEEMKILFDMTGTHFALAHTIHGVVADPNKDPKPQLKIILSIDQQRSSTPQAFLDQLYHQIFSRIPKSLLPRILRVVGAILVPDAYALYPVPPLLELVFSFEEGEVQELFSHLESLFDLGDRVSSRIRVYHKTLADFLFDPSRSKQYGLFMEKSVVSKGIQDSVHSVFFLKQVPSRPALAALCIYIRQLYYHGPAINPLWFLVPSGLRRISKRTRPEQSPWAVLFCRQQGECQGAPILHKLATPDFEQYSAQMKKDSSRSYVEAYSVYEHSPFGRLCLFCLEYAFAQTFDESLDMFYQAFIRHALRSDSELLELDQSIGWNLITCNLDNLARGCIYVRAQRDAERGAYVTMCKQVVYDILKPEWVLSRLGMLRLWHDGGHRITDNPWEHAGRQADVEIASESQLSCSKCIEVLDICKAQLLVWLLSEGALDGDTTFHQKIFDHVRPNPTLWNHGELVWFWGILFRSEDPESLGGDAELKRTAVSVNDQRVKLEGVIRERMTRMISDAYDGTYVFSGVVFPYSRACIPNDLSEEHTILVAKRREAWSQGDDLTDVFYTYPPGSQ